jgi:hypothetical protein
MLVPKAEQERPETLNQRHLSSTSSNAAAYCVCVSPLRTIRSAPCVRPSVRVSHLVVRFESLMSVRDEGRRVSEEAE